MRESNVIDLCPKCRCRMTDGKCGDCGYVERATVLESSNRDHSRCSWAADSKRCRYVGSMALNTQGGGPWYCGGHFRAVQTLDGVLGARVVQESHERIASGLDYSSKALALAARTQPARELVVQNSDRELTLAPNEVRSLPANVKRILAPRPRMTEREEQDRRALLLEQATRAAERLQPLGMRE